MKTRHFPIFIFGTAVAALIQPYVAHAISPEEINWIALQATVRIEGSSSGSGVIVYSRNGNYIVLTAKHNLDRDENGNVDNSYAIVTIDGQRHIPAQTLLHPELDIAEVQFSSQQNYQEAPIGNSDSLQVGSRVYIAGWSSQTVVVQEQPYVMTAGEVNTLLQQPRQGYSLLYSNQTRDGMSGGPVFNELGQVVGIHGQADVNAIHGQQGTLGIPINIILDALQNFQSHEQLSATVHSEVSTDESVAEALKAIREERFADAILISNQAIRNNPEMAYAYSTRAWAQIRLTLLETRGFILTELEEIPIAKRDLDESLRLDPEHSPSYFYSGFMHTGNHPSSDTPNSRIALNYFDQAIQYAERFDPIYKALAHLGKCAISQDFLTYDFNQRDYETFVESCQQAITLLSNTDVRNSPLAPELQAFEDTIAIIRIIQETGEACNRHHSLSIEREEINLRREEVFRQRQDVFSDRLNITTEVRNELANRQSEWDNIPNEPDRMLRIIIERDNLTTEIRNEIAARENELDRELDNLWNELDRISRGISDSLDTCHENPLFGWDYRDFLLLNIPLNFIEP